MLDADAYFPLSLPPNGKKLPMELNFLSIGESVRKRREDLGYTQNDVSEISGVAERTIRSIEGGENSNLSNLVKIMDVLGLELSVQIKQMGND
jgi:transcriptional regulator with XRE-family HTH domain